MQVFMTFMVLWIVEVDTAAGCFVLFYMGQVWHMHKRERVHGRFLRAYCVLLRYHLGARNHEKSRVGAPFEASETCAGSVILLGLMQTLLSPVHLVLETISDLSESTVGLGTLIESFFCCIDCYRNYIAMYSRDALQDARCGSTAPRLSVRM